MPWCETCSAFRDEAEVGEGGTCSHCGSVIVAQRRVPWHFKAMIAATAAYLLYRIGQGIDWIVRHVGSHPVHH